MKICFHLNKNFSLPKAHLMWLCWTRRTSKVRVAPPSIHNIFWKKCTDKNHNEDSQKASLNRNSHRSELRLRPGMTSPVPSSPYARWGGTLDENQFFFYYAFWTVFFNFLKLSLIFLYFFSNCFKFILKFPPCFSSMFWFFLLHFFNVLFSICLLFQYDF